MKFYISLNNFSLIIIFLFLNCNVFGFNLQNESIIENCIPNDTKEINITETNQQIQILLSRNNCEDEEMLVAYIRVYIDKDLGDQINFNVVDIDLNNTYDNMEEETEEEEEEIIEEEEEIIEEEEEIFEEEEEIFEEEEIIEEEEEIFEEEEEFDDEEIEEETSDEEKESDSPEEDKTEEEEEIEPDSPEEDKTEEEEIEPDSPEGDKSEEEEETEPDSPEEDKPEEEEKEPDTTDDDIPDEEIENDSAVEDRNYESINYNSIHNYIYLYNDNIYNSSNESVHIHFYLTDNIIDTFNQSSPINNSTELNIRTFDFENSGYYYIKLIYREEKRKVPERNCTLNYSLLIDFYNKIKYNYHEKAHNIPPFYYKKNKFIKESILLTLLSSGVYDFNFNYTIYEIKNFTKEVSEPIPVDKKTFFNGYSLIIDHNILGNDDIERFIEFNIGVDNQEIITVNARKYKLEEIEITVNNHYDVFLSEESSECFKFKKANKEENQYVLNFLSLTKNIEVKCDSETKGYDINKESKVKVYDSDDCKKICFYQKNENNYNWGSVSFEVMPIENKESIVINNPFPLIRNLWTRHYLNPKTSTFYRPEVYLNPETPVKISFHMIKGYSKLFFDEEGNKDYSSFANETYLKDLYSYKDINGFISTKISSSSMNNESKFLVYCLEDEDDGIGEGEGCIFDIEIKNEDEVSFLYPNFRIHSFVLKDEKERFKINAKDFKDGVDFLSIFVNSFLNEANVTIFTDDTIFKKNISNDDYLKKNKLSFDISKDDMPKNTNYLFIEISSLTNLYYGINIKFNSNNQKDVQYIENNILYHYQMDKKNISFNFINKDEEYVVSYIINIDTFGNKLKFDNEEELIQVNDLIQKEISSSDSFSITNENYAQDNRYLFSLEYHEISKHNKIFMENGYIYKNRFTKESPESNKVNYYFLLFKNDTFDRISLNIRKYSDKKINIAISSGSNSQSEIFMELSKIIVIKNDLLTCERNNYGDYCEILVEISADLNDNKDLDFSIVLMKYESDETDIYLPQNTFMSNLLDDSSIHNYYIEIEKNEGGKIYVDFYEGEGKATAMIYNNNQLLDGKDIGFKYYNKYFDINESFTEDCDKVCIIKIQVLLDKPLIHGSQYKYNIYSNIKPNKADFYINVPELEYVYGNLEDENSIDYYKTKIAKNATQKIAIFVNCEDCIINIEDNNSNEGINIIMRDYFIIDSKEEIYYTIKNNPKKKSSQRYDIRIISLEKNGDLIIPMTTLRNAFCKIKKNKICTFLVTKEKYNKINKMIFAVPDNDKVQITVKENDNNILNGIKYIEFDINNIEEKRVFKIEVKSDYNDTITFVSSHFNLISMNYSYPEDYYIVDLGKDNNETVSPWDKNGFMNYDINLLKGKGYVKFYKNDDEKYYLNRGFRENLNLLFNSNDSLGNKTDILFYAEKASIFIYRIILNNQDINLSEINFQRSSYINYINEKDYDENWPLQFYMKITNDEINDININYKFWKNYDDESDKTFEPKDEYYFTTIELVNKRFILDKKLNNENIETGNNAAINDLSDYIYEFTAGYSLIGLEDIFEAKKNLPNNEECYLFISIYYKQNISNINDKNINVVLTAFDFSENNVLPMNEYLLMSVNESRSINIGRKEFESFNYSFIELAYTNITYSPNDISYMGIHGKDFYNMTNNENQIFKFNNKNINDTITNLIIKYGLSNYEDFSYFEFKNETIKYENEFISFEPIVAKKDDLFQENEIYIINNIKIFKVEDNKTFIPDSIYEISNYTEYKKYINNGNKNENNSLDIHTINFGYYYVYIMSEVRMGYIYEYINYKPLYIEKIADELWHHINITYGDGEFSPKYSRNMKYIVENIIGGENDYIKLSLKHKNYYDENQIYVSGNKDIFNSSKPYQESLYKVTERDNALIIPVKEVINTTLYIRIPCNELCDYTFYYKVYTKENLTLNSSECFDINIIENNLNILHTFVNSNEASLFTMTSYSLEDFNVNVGNTVDLHKTYFNGYSHLITDNNNNGSNIKFKIGFNSENLRIKTCHRYIKDSIDEISDIKNIFVGDMKYIGFKEKNKGDCFSIYKDPKTNNRDISEYQINFITKTKNLKIDLYKDINKTNNNDIILPNEESFTYRFKSSSDGFCIYSNSDEDSGALFQLLPIYSNSYIPQSLIMPLIKGVSTRQELKKGEILYYRINENSKNSSSIKVHFQTLSGNPNIYSSECKDYPNCAIDINKIESLGEESKIKDYYNNNYYFDIKIKSEDIYKKPEFPIVIVQCPNDDNEEDECNYYIEMTNDFETILLNKNRKIYSFIDEKVTHKYKIDLSNDEYSKNKNSEIYIQLYSFAGKMNLNVQSDVSEDNYKNYNYNDNGIFYIAKLDNAGEFNIEINSNNCSYSSYSLFYYILHEGDNSIYLPSGEVHYNIISSNKITYKYYFQDKAKTTNINYIASINGINCDLKINGQIKRYNQTKVNANEAISISSNLENGNKCEFTISAIALNNDKREKELIFNDRTYHYYVFNSDFNYLYIDYLVQKDELPNKEIFINVNKKSNNNLKITYEEQKKIIYDYNEIVSLTKSTDKSEYMNLYYFRIKIEPENDKNNDVSFKLKINGNRDIYMSYIDQDEIEKGIVYKNTDVKYYYEYYQFSDPNNIEQIFLDCKGLAELANVEITINDNKMTDKENYFEMKKNYINLKYNNKCNNGCKITFTISLLKKHYNYYHIYMLSANKELEIKKNMNIYGNLNGGKEHKFLTKLNNGESEIIFNINCLKCRVNIKNKENQKLSESGRVKVSGTGPFLSYSIENTDNSKNNYYHFSIINEDSPKYIDQSESIFCESNCKFILPLYQFYSYTKESILFYVPQTEQVIIHQNIVPGNASYTYLHDFTLKNNINSSSNYPISNRLFINISEYNDVDAYIQIQVVSKYNLNITFNFIVSKFYQSLIENDNKIIYPQNIFTINNNNENIEISYPDNNKMNIHLISGAGIVKTNNKEQYNLNYESQELISILNDKVKEFRSSSEEGFSFYLNIENTNIFNLLMNKTSYLKYTYNEDKFRIYFYIQNKETKRDLYINYHFSKLETNKNFINVQNESFSFKINGHGIEEKIIDQNKTEEYYSTKNILNVYYKGSRRGYIYLAQSYLERMNNRPLNFTVDSAQKKYANNINFDITPIYTGGEEEKDDNHKYIVELPRNTYIEFKLHTYKNIYLKKPSYSYKYVNFEIGNIDYNINLNKYNSTNIYGLGKNNYILNDDLKDYNIIMPKNESKSILLKYTTKENNSIIISFHNESISAIPTDDDNTTFSIEFENVYTIINDNYTNYTITYIFLLYNYLDFEKESEIDTILAAPYPINTFRKELTEEELKNEKLQYSVVFGKQEYGQYCINILAEIYYNNSFEYYSYKSASFIYYPTKPISFDKSWIVILVIILVIFVLLILFLVKAYLDKKKEEKRIDDKKEKLLTNRIEMSE